jgi:putative acetyltransferase
VDDKVTIRSERVTDFHAIAQVHAEAFTHSLGMGEVTMVDALRRGASYRSDWALLAESPHGDVVGHVMLTPINVTFHGTVVRGAILAPLAVRPTWQGRGIGSKLMEMVNDVARKSGLDMVMLLGHPSYYPRFGYQTGMFGRVGLSVQRVGGETPPSCTIRRVCTDDIPFLIQLWDQWFRAVDLTIHPGYALTDWISANPQTVSGVLTLDGADIGYIRFSRERKTTVHCLLARDENAFHAIMNWLASEDDADSWVLPIHPSSAMIRSVSCPWGPVFEPWEAAMILPVNDACPNVLAYCRAVREGTRSPGLVVWPTVFDVG